MGLPVSFQNHILGAMDRGMHSCRISCGLISQENTLSTFDLWKSVSNMSVKLTQL